MTYSSNADCYGTTDTGNKSQTQDLLRTTNFSVTVLVIARHDLRQPLQAIVGAHELLARRVTAGSERQHLERSEQGSAQLEEKLDQLVDALQLQQRASRIELEPVRLEYILQRLALQLDGPAQRSWIDFRLVPTPAVILSQPVLLDGILPNLARNALDHTPAGGRVLAGCRRRGATTSYRGSRHRPGHSGRQSEQHIRALYPPRHDALRGARTWAVHRQAGSSLARTSHRALFGSGPRFVL